NHLLRRVHLCSSSFLCSAAATTEIYALSLHDALPISRPDDLAAAVITEILKRVPGLDPNDVEDVILGCAMPEAEQGHNVARDVVDRKSTRLNSSHVAISYAVFCLKKKT